MEPIQSTYQQLKFVFCCLTFGLLAPVLVKFRQSKSVSKTISYNVRESYEMTVNEDEEDIQMRQGLFQAPTKK